MYIFREDFLLFDQSVERSLPNGNNVKDPKYSRFNEYAVSKKISQKSRWRNVQNRQRIFLMKITEHKYHIYLHAKSVGYNW